MEITRDTVFEVYPHDCWWWYGPIGYRGFYSEPCESAEEAWQMVEAELASVKEASE